MLHCNVMYLESFFRQKHLKDIHQITRTFTTTSQFSKTFLLRKQKLKMQ